MNFTVRFIEGLFHMFYCNCRPGKRRFVTPGNRYKVVRYMGLTRLFFPLSVLSP